MGGGLMQLVAYGAQDIYLTGNPQITFFKVVYRRHTNFSMEAIEQTWAGNEGTGSAGSCTATISRNGDLVYRMYLEVDMAALDVVAGHNPMAQVITEVELEIGGQKIDKQTGLWMHVWSCLTQPNSSAFTGVSSAANQGTGTLYQNTTGMGGFGTASYAQRFWVPLQFWFCRNPGLALPLIALQYHEVKVKLEHNFKKANNAFCKSNKLWCDYIYLDTDERRRFAQVSHEYLIEQIQETSVTPEASSDLNFNHPIKELVFVNSDGGENSEGVIKVSGAVAAAGIGSDSATYQLKLNGHDRFAERDYRYFSRTQVWEHHTGPGGLESKTTAAGGRLNDAIGVYSFALKPEEHQPSGTCNFSRIDNAQFVGSVGTNADKVFAVNYNVLRIMSGMGGLAYSN